MDFSEVNLSKLRTKYLDAEHKLSWTKNAASIRYAQFAALCIYRCMELADAGAAEKMREEFGL